MSTGIRIQESQITSKGEKEKIGFECLLEGFRLILDHVSPP